VAAVAGDASEQERVEVCVCVCLGGARLPRLLEHWGDGIWSLVVGVAGEWGTGEAAPRRDPKVCRRSHERAGKGMQEY
jgi:hypothetical protein